jgi:hypothetical protein
MDQSPQFPPKLVLKGFAATSWMPLIGLFPLVIALFIFIGMSASGSGNLEEWQMPLLYITLLAGGVFVITCTITLLARWWEIQSIKRVYANIWAVFPQFKSAEQWQRFIEREREKGLANIHFEWIGLLIVTVVVVVVGVFGLASGAGIEIVFGLLGFEAIIAVIITGRWLRQKLDVTARHKRRVQMPLPNVVISKHGHYHEDEGFDSLRGIQSITWKDATKSRPAKMTFTVRTPFIETLAYSRGISVPRYYEVEVAILKDDENTAKALIERFQALTQ